MSRNSHFVVGLWVAIGLEVVRCIVDPKNRLVAKLHRSG